MNSMVQWLGVSGCDFAPPKNYVVKLRMFMNNEFRRMCNKEVVMRIGYCPVCRQTEGHKKVVMRIGYCPVCRQTEGHKDVVMRIGYCPVCRQTEGHKDVVLRIGYCPVCRQTEGQRCKVNSNCPAAGRNCDQRFPYRRAQRCVCYEQRFAVTTFHDLFILKCLSTG
jgi:ribosomal protein L33